MTTLYRLPEGEFLGDDIPWTHRGPPCNHAWACRVCGRMWAWRIVPKTPGYASHFFIWSAICPDCPGDYFNPAGSLLGPLMNEELKTLPEPLVRRELLIHLDHYERYKE